MDVILTVYLTIIACAGFVQTKPETDNFNLSDVYNKLETLEKKYSDVVTEVKELKSQNQKLEEKILEKRVRQQAAFTAFNGYVQGTIYNAGDVIRFQDVHTNIGGAYDEERSTFTCPITGTYLFGVSLFSLDDYFVEACISVGGICTSGMHLNDNGWHFGGTTEVIDCAAGTEVWITVVTNNNALAEVWNGNKVATFTGVLIEAEL